VNIQPHKEPDSPDLKQLKKLCEEDPQAKQFFLAVKDRRDIAQSTVERIRQLAGIEDSKEGRKEALELCKNLAKANCGKIRMGRRGSKSRLVWGFSRSGIAKLVFGDSEIDVNIELDEEIREDAEIREDVQEHPEPHPQFDEYKLRLRVQDDVFVTIRLPKDVTKRELEKLADRIKALSIID
jgi:hypothetical protein